METHISHLLFGQTGLNWLVTEKTLEITPSEQVCTVRTLNNHIAVKIVLLVVSEPVITLAYSH